MAYTSKWEQRKQQQPLLNRHSSWLIITACFLASPTTRSRSAVPCDHGWCSAEQKPYIASMGIYVCKASTLKVMLQQKFRCVQVAIWCLCPWLWVGRSHWWQSVPASASAVSICGSAQQQAVTGDIG